MLGKAFESLMASADRKSSGAFYTPQTLVERVEARIVSAVEVPSGFVIRQCASPACSLIDKEECARAASDPAKARAG